MLCSFVDADNYTAEEVREDSTLVTHRSHLNSMCFHTLDTRNYRDT